MESTFRPMTKKFGYNNICRGRLSHLRTNLPATDAVQTVWHIRRSFPSWEVQQVAEAARIRMQSDTPTDDKVAEILDEPLSGEWDSYTNIYEAAKVTGWGCDFLKEVWRSDVECRRTPNGVMIHRHELPYLKSVYDDLQAGTVVRLKDYCYDHGQHMERLAKAAVGLSIWPRLLLRISTSFWDLDDLNYVQNRLNGNF